MDGTDSSEVVVSEEGQEDVGADETEEKVSNEPGEAVDTNQMGTPGLPSGEGQTAGELGEKEEEPGGHEEVGEEGVTHPGDNGQEVGEAEGGQVEVMTEPKVDEEKEEERKGEEEDEERKGEEEERKGEEEERKGEEEEKQEERKGEEEERKGEEEERKGEEEEKQEERKGEEEEKQEERKGEEEEKQEERKGEEEEERKGEEEREAGGRVEEEGQKEKVEEQEISYDYEDLKSGPEAVNLSPDISLKLHHSFGYECQKRNNLVVLDKNTVAFSAGNLVQLLDLSSMEQRCLRSLGGGGIGALAVHPSRQFLAVGEKGKQPVIAILTYPQLQLHRLLKGGTEEMYSHMNFSSGEGALLASVGGHPDFMLTVWDWKKESTVLRSKAFSQDVYRVTFSPDNPGQLTTSGTGHIRFWKMATTFTGLKLQGQLGKFGRTELSDIAAYVELPDGKVLSGTEWGNMLLWDGGFIKVEISRKNKKYCHHGMIEAVFLDEGELISAGVDGYIRVWDFETIDNADITDENAAFEMDPLTEIRVGHDVSLKTLCRSADPDTPTLWYAQDAAGAIWRVDITASHTRQPPEKLVSYHSGSVCGLSCSPAGYQAASIGHDGSVRVYDLATRELLCHTHLSGGGASLLWAPPTVESPSTTLLAGFRDGVMSIEDAKQKTEHDRRVKQAEMRKQNVRREVGRLRRTFLQLVQRNGELPRHLQLPATEFIMDPSLEAGMKERAQQQVELVRREMAWEAEKHVIGLNKLHSWFKAIVECERIVVWSFEGTHSVSSYRMAQLSPAFQALLEKELSTEYLQTPWTVALSVKRLRSHVQMKKMKEQLDTVGEMAGEGTGGQEQEKSEVKLTKQEARRLRKEQRKKEWEELMARKPGKGEEDPEEAELVEKFKRNMGDYKLKTASDYVVPKTQRVTFSKKRRSLLLLRRQIFERKREYNSRLMSLRDRKVAILDKASSMMRELELVQSYLEPSLRLPLPVLPALRPEEVPEKQREFTKESLLQFAAEKEERERIEREAAAGVGEGFGGFGGFGGGGGGEGERPQEKEADDEEVDQPEGQATEEDRERGLEVTSDLQQQEPEEEEDGGIPLQLSELDILIQQEEQVQLLFQQSALVKELEEMIRSFDEALLRLHHEKTQLDCIMITASLKHITQFQELTLLREFEKKELTFTSRYQTKKKESCDMDAKIKDLGDQLKEHEKNLAHLQEREKALVTQFMERVGEGNRFKDFLLKVFRKKIKRTKPKGDGGEKGEEQGGEEEEEEEEDSEEESDSDFFSSSEEESDGGGEEGGIDDSVCPAGCDPTLFSLACSLRETRLDIEEGIVEEKKTTEQCRKELEASKKKLKSMDSHVKTAQSELEAFQLKKQQRLNELDQVVVLKLHQILHHRGQEGPPTSTSPCIVFPAGTLTNLSHRIVTVKEEKKSEKQRYKELHHHHVRLVRERRELEAKAKEWEEKVHQSMMLKFGRVVDLDHLGGVASNRTTEELRAKLQQQETQQARELVALQSQVERAKKQLVGVVRENTQHLTRLHDLMTSQESLETRLNARQKSLRGEVGGAMEGGEEEEERERLYHLTALQAQEIATLQHEIRILSTKGDKILPPDEPPVGPPPAGMSPIM